MDDRYVSFRGQDGNEAEEFIQAVRRAAFNANKDRDDEWMARFASTCMSGKALRWFESLDDDVQESWKRLKKAILVRYPPADEDAIVPSASAAPPAAAAAAPPAAPWPSSFPQVDFAPPAAVPRPQYVPPHLRNLIDGAPPQVDFAPPAAVQRPQYVPPHLRRPFDGATGVIEIRYYQTNRVMGYLSQTLRDNGATQVTRSGKSSAQRVTVKNEPYSTYSNIALNTGPRARNKFFGLTWLHQRGARAPVGYRYAATVFTQSIDGAGSSVNSSFYEGGSEATIWDVLSDGKVSATSDGKPLEFYVYDETDQINLFPDFNAYVSSRGVGHQWDRVNLIFNQE